MTPSRFFIFILNQGYGPMFELAACLNAVWTFRAFFFDCCLLSYRKREPP
jgi:hypothetical protein